MNPQMRSMDSSLRWNRINHGCDLFDSSLHLCNSGLCQINIHSLVFFWKHLGLMYIVME